MMVLMGVHVVLVLVLLVLLFPVMVLSVMVMMARTAKVRGEKRCSVIPWPYQELRSLDRLFCDSQALSKRPPFLGDR